MEVGQRPGHGLPEAAGSYRRGKALKLMQFSLTLANKFVLEDLREAWGCTGSEVVAKLLKEAESRYRKEIRTAQEKRWEAQKRQIES
ncbi:MAG: hypothetical protein M0041_03330 [Nitrospiraceae bacterium]|nr:hypothetical protein [Nitrospiraceae bacterium]